MGRVRRAPVKGFFSDELREKSGHQSVPVLGLPQESAPQAILWSLATEP